MKCVVRKEKLPYWSRLWDYFTQEDILYSSQSKDQEKAESGVDKENVALPINGKKKGLSSGVI